MASWVRKKLRKLETHRSSRLLLSSQSPVSFSTGSKSQELVVAADLGCAWCKQRTADAISNIEINDIESIVVDVMKKKVILELKSVSRSPTTKVAAVHNKPS